MEYSSPDAAQTISGFVVCQTAPASIVPSWRCFGLDLRVVFRSMIWHIDFRFWKSLNGDSCVSPPEPPLPL